MSIEDKISIHHQIRIKHEAAYLLELMAVNAYGRGRLDVYEKYSEYASKKEEEAKALADKVKSLNSLLKLV